MLDQQDLQAIAQLINVNIQPLRDDINGVKQDLTETNRRLDQMESRMGQMENRMDQVDDHLAVLDKKVSKIGVTQENVVAKQIGLLCEANTENLPKLKKIDRIEASLNELRSDVSMIRDVVAGHSAETIRLSQAK